MSENHQGASMEGVCGFERETIEEDRKKMIRPVLFLTAIWNCRPDFFFFFDSDFPIKKFNYWDNGCEKITVPILYFDGH